jgi:hypothetical protein
MDEINTILFIATGQNVLWSHILQGTGKYEKSTWIFIQWLLNVPYIPTVSGRNIYRAQSTAICLIVKLTFAVAWTRASQRPLCQMLGHQPVALLEEGRVFRRSHLVEESYVTGRCAPEGVIEILSLSLLPGCHKVSSFLCLEISTLCTSSTQTQK